MMAKAIRGKYDVGFKELGTASVPALAFIELSSISRGLYLTDTVLKKAPVRVVTSQPVSGGKHVLLFIGDVASVSESLEAAIAATDGTLVKQILIPGVHEDLAPFLESLWSAPTYGEPTLVGPRDGDSVGIVESATLAGAILAADRALKAANVTLCRMRLGHGIGGKAYFVLKGTQASVEAAIEAAQESLKENETVGRVDLIARPQEETLAHF